MFLVYRKLLGDINSDHVGRAERVQEKKTTVVVTPADLRGL